MSGRMEEARRVREQLMDQLERERDEARRELVRLRRAAGAYLATTEGRAVTFREGLTRAELAAAVEGKP